MRLTTLAEHYGIPEDENVADTTWLEMAGRFLRHLRAVTEACSEPGPFVYAVYENRIERLPLDP